MIMENIDKVHDNKAMAKILNDSFASAFTIKDATNVPNPVSVISKGTFFNEDIKIKVKALFQEVNIFPFGEA